MSRHLAFDAGVGTPVVVIRDDGSALETVTRSRPRQLGGAWVVKVDGLAGGFCPIERVHPRSSPLSGEDAVMIAALLEDRDFRIRLNAFAIDVTNLIEDFSSDPLVCDQLHRYASSTERAELVLAVMLGWTLGFGPTPRDQYLPQQLAVVAQTAAVSAKSAEAHERRGRH